MAYETAHVHHVQQEQVGVIVPGSDEAQGQDRNRWVQELKRPTGPRPPNALVKEGVTV